MTERKRFLFRSLASIIDQMLLSGLNFLIGMVLIRFATKETYGLYSQLFAVSVLTTTLLESTVGSALTTLAYRLSPEDRLKLVARSQKIQMALAFGLALVCACGLWVVSLQVSLIEGPVVLSVVFGLFIFAQSAREYCRTALFIESKPEAVAKLDLVFVCLTLAGAGGIFLVDEFTVTEVILVLAAANALAALTLFHRINKPAGIKTSREDYAKDFRALWSLSRWALIGSVVGWAANNSYLYFAGGFMGVAALADLNASRLLLVPVSMVGMAWSRVARPVYGEAIAAADWQRLRLFQTRSLLALELFAALYVVSLLLAFPWLSTHVLGPKYQNIAPLLLLWGIYFAVNMARNAGTTLLTSYGAFRALFWQGMLSLPVLVLACWIAIPRWGLVGALVGMITVEVWELLVNWIYLLPRARQIRLVVD